MTQLALLKALQRKGFHIETLIDLEGRRKEIERNRNWKNAEVLVEKYSGKEVRWDDPELLEDLSGLSDYGLGAFWILCDAEDLGHKVYFPAS